MKLGCGGGAGKDSGLTSQASVLGQKQTCSVAMHSCLSDLVWFLPAGPETDVNLVFSSIRVPVVYINKAVKNKQTNQKHKNKSSPSESLPTLNILCQARLPVASPE